MNKNSDFTEEMIRNVEDETSDMIEGMIDEIENETSEAVDEVIEEVENEVPESVEEEMEQVEELVEDIPLPEKTKKHIKAKHLVEKAKKIVDESNKRTESCKLLLEADLKEYEHAKSEL
ncbi:MAG: hypothetical protein OQK45_04100, partial [Sulfurovum sp.]|nr:hypothetical protein [Sulfurovum sp.]